MFSILTTLCSEEIKNMIQNARKNRSLNIPGEANDMIFIAKKLYDEIKGVANQKRKY